MQVADSLPDTSVSSSPRAQRGARPALNLVLLSLFIFCFVNLAARYLYFRSTDKDGLCFAVNRFALAGPKSSAIIVGSSVANHLFNSLKPSEQEALHITSLAYNLQMPSDSLILVHKILPVASSGKCVVFCVTPRDFFDNDAAPVTRSTTFKRLVSIFDVVSLIPILHLDVQQSVESFCCKFLPLYEIRNSIQSRFADACNAVYAKILPFEKTNSESAWARSVREYAWRYQGISLSRQAYQFDRLGETIGLCRSRGFKVLVVNLPLTKANLSLLPSGFYEQFRATLGSVAARNHAEFVDTSNLSLTNSDYEDCAHLNSVGGQKTFAAIEPTLQSLQRK